MKYLIIVLFLFFAYASAEEVPDNITTQETAIDSSTQKSKYSILTIEQKNLLLTVLSWPFVYIIQPTVEFLLYPAIPPLLYASREDLIEKGKNLITYGENGQIMFYPVMNIRVGSSSNIGLTYRHSDIFLNKDFFFLSPRYYVNGDWDISLRYQKKEILESSFYFGLNASYREDGNGSFREIDGTTYNYADSSISINTNLGFSLVKNWDLLFGVAVNFHRFDYPNLNDTVIINDYVLNRGIYRSFESFPLSVSLLNNTLNEQFTATKGKKFSLAYSYVPVSPYNGSYEHNYHVVESRLVNYFLLGNKNYAMTVAESNANREKLKNLSFREAMEMFNPINIKEEILDKRVFITQLRFRYTIEENRDKAPFTAMGRLGGNFPLRAYDDGYFTAPLVAGVSTEYRWPIDRYADALIFNEYGVYAEDFSHLSILKLKNSYGFGFRVRTPNLFIMRFVLAFHGTQGITLIFTTRPEYE